MLGPRIASALILIPAVLLLLWLGPETTALTTAAAAAISVYEFYVMAARSKYRYDLSRAPGYIAATGFSLAGYLTSSGLMLIIAIALAIGLLVITRLRRTVPTGALQPGFGTIWGLSFFIPLYCGLPLGLIALIRTERDKTQLSNEAIWWIVLICLATWGTDTGGYTFGRLFGRHKLAPSISPKKTIEGAIGGIVTGILGVALVGGFALKIPIYLTLPLGFVLAVGSIIGDLFESWIKRRFDTKDSGHLIPGHGGLLDRIDSFLAVALLTYLFTIFYH